MQISFIFLLVVLSLSACAATASDDRHHTLVGEIHIKGNEPFPTVILETRSHDNWEVVGVPLDEARSLLGLQVKVQGTVIRVPGPGVWLPSLRVAEPPRAIGR